MTKKPPAQGAAKPPKKKKNWFWPLFLLSWLLLIYYLSNQPGLDTLPILYKLGLIPPINDKTLAQELEHVVRKMAHIGAYAVLYMLTFSTVQGLQKKPKSYQAIIRATLFSLVFSFVFAISDEIHQYFVVDRSARIFDVIIDMFGVFLGQAALLLLLHLRRKKRGRQARK